MSRITSHPRLRLWTLVGLLALVALSFAYFLMLETGAFDSKPKKYPDMALKAQAFKNWDRSGTTIEDGYPNLAEWLEDSSHFGNWNQRPQTALPEGNKPIPLESWPHHLKLAAQGMQELSADPRILDAWEERHYVKVSMLAPWVGPGVVSLLCQDLPPWLARTRLLERVGLTEPLTDASFLLLARMPEMQNPYESMENYRRGFHSLRALLWLGLFVEFEDGQSDLDAFGKKLDQLPAPGREFAREGLLARFCFLERDVTCERNQIAISPLKEQLEEAMKSKEKFTEWWARLRLCPNRTIEQAHALTVADLATLDQPAALRSLPQWPAPDWWTRFSPAPNASAPEYLGRSVFSSRASESLTEWLARYFDPLAADRELLRCAVAVARYRRAHGEAWPGSLADLVPDFLPSVPVDPYDGKPLRYDAKRHLLWSAGSDLRDDGGRLPPSADQPVPGVGSLGPDSTEPTVDLGILLGL